MSSDVINQDANSVKMLKWNFENNSIKLEDYTAAVDLLQPQPAEEGLNDLLKVRLY